MEDQRPLAAVKYRLKQHGHVPRHPPAGRSAPPPEGHPVHLTPVSRSRTCNRDQGTWERGAHHRRPPCPSGRRFTVNSGSPGPAQQWPGSHVSTGQHLVPRLMSGISQAQSAGSISVARSTTKTQVSDLGLVCVWASSGTLHQKAPRRPSRRLPRLRRPRTRHRLQSLVGAVGESPAYPCCPRRCGLFGVPGSCGSGFSYVVGEVPRLAAQGLLHAVGEVGPAAVEDLRHEVCQLGGE